MKYRNLFDKASEGLILLTIDGKIVELNQSFAQMHGYTVEEMKNMDIKDLDVLREDAFDGRAEVMRRILAGEVVRFEVEHYHKDGHSFFMSDTVSLITIAEQQYFLAFHQDITDRKQAEEKLRNNEDRLRAITESVPDTILELDSKGTILYINRILPPLNMEDVIGEIFYKWISPECHTIVIQAMDRVFCDAIPQTYEIQGFGVNGELTWYESRISPVVVNSQVINAVLITNDITERKQAEEKLRESEYEFRLLAESMPQIVWITEPDGNNIYFNHQYQDYTGLTLEESYGTGWIKSFHPDDKQLAWDAWQNAVNNNDMYSIECRLRKYDGSYCWWLIRGVPVLDINGQISKWFGTCTDINEIKQAEKLLEQQYEEYMQLNEQLRVSNYHLEIEKEHAQESEKLKTAFLQNMSHEIRTPLNGILGFSNLLQADDLTKEEIKEYTGVIQNSGQRLMETVGNILDISKIETGQIEIKNKSFSLNALMSSLLTFFSNTATIKGVILDYHVALKTPDSFIESDELKLNQILSNLINNALKFTTEGKVEFGYTLKNSEIEFYVKDTGVGIPEESKNRMFVRFAQANLSITRGYEGAGLGLSICKGLVELLDGKIWFESEVNVGSTFFFTVPYKPITIIVILTQYEIQ